MKPKVALRRRPDKLRPVSDDQPSSPSPRLICYLSPIYGLFTIADSLGKKIILLILTGVQLLVGLGILVGIVIVAQISLTSVDNSVMGMEGTLEEMNVVLTEMNQALVAMNQALEPVKEMEVMNTGAAKVTARAKVGKLSI